jgi:hypothetical protein
MSSDERNIGASGRALRLAGFLFWNGSVFRALGRNSFDRFRFGEVFGGVQPDPARRGRIAQLTRYVQAKFGLPTQILGTAHDAPSCVVFLTGASKKLLVCPLKGRHRFFCSAPLAYKTKRTRLGTVPDIRQNSENYLKLFAVKHPLIMGCDSPVTFAGRLLESFDVQ